MLSFKSNFTFGIILILCHSSVIYGLKGNVVVLELLFLAERRLLRSGPRRRASAMRSGRRWTGLILGARRGWALRAGRAPFAGAEELEVFHHHGQFAALAAA